MAFIDTYYSSDNPMQSSSSSTSADGQAQYDFIEIDPPTVENLTPCECVSDNEHADAAEASGDMAAFLARLQEKADNMTVRGDHWDANTGLYVCGRCGRMWDGTQAFYTKRL